MNKGFTLSELLIALAILGIIATFAIPKVLQSQQDSKKKAIFRETLAALSDATYMGTVTHELDSATTGATMRAYYSKRLNYVKACTASITEGCFATTDVASCQDTSGYLLHNGAGLDEFEGPTLEPGGGIWRGLCVDWNGTQGPNLRGDDVMRIVIYYGTGPSLGNAAGTVKPNTNAQDTTLFNWVFSN
jgi:prepilin-type N-terminal cleavage/methylation domain-containing protein